MFHLYLLYRVYIHYSFLRAGYIIFNEYMELLGGVGR